MTEQVFTVTPTHLELLRRMCVGWQDCETGAPEIDPKRPYGNSSVAADILEIFGEEYDREEGPTEEQERRAMVLHRQTEVALQCCLSALSFEPGLYRRINYRWQRDTQ
jgi:hypothetical protein